MEPGTHAYLTGNTDGLSGDVTMINGDATGIYGDASGCIGLLDSCNLSQEDREKGVCIDDLILTAPSP